MKLWNKGYKLNEQIEDFTVGEDYILDQKLVKYDCLASMAHAKMLAKIGILKNSESQKIIKELSNIVALEKLGKFIIMKKDEDCHTSIENYLTKKLGSLGKKIHTARSRNDQVLVALRLYYKDKLKSTIKLTGDLIQFVNNFSRRYGKIELPGYTHTRKAMPSSIELWSEAIVDSMADNLKIIKLCLELVDQSPLGTGAGYGIPLKIDRKYTAKMLDFKKVQKNPIYTQNSRGKFESTILHSLTQIMFDLNKVATDLIIFSLPEFGYFELPKEFCTGSSIMPQKRNPDVLELLRAKYHVVVSYEFQVKNIIGNLLSGYNRDLQLLKEPIMKGFDIVQKSLSIMNLIFKELRVNEVSCRKALTEDIYATQKAYELVKRGIPFREAYKRISRELKI